MGAETRISNICIAEAENEMNAFFAKEKCLVSNADMTEIKAVMIFMKKKAKSDLARKKEATKKSFLNQAEREREKLVSKTPMNQDQTRQSVEEIQSLIKIMKKSTEEQADRESKDLVADETENEIEQFFGRAPFKNSRKETFQNVDEVQSIIQFMQEKPKQKTKAVGLADMTQTPNEKQQNFNKMESLMKKEAKETSLTNAEDLKIEREIERNMQMFSHSTHTKIGKVADNAEMQRIMQFLNQK